MPQNLPATESRPWLGVGPPPPGSEKEGRKKGGKEGREEQGKVGHQGIMAARQMGAVRVGSNGPN